MIERNRQDFRPEYLAFAEQLADRLWPRLEPLRAGGGVVAIGGESGSGKSVTASCLVQVFEQRGVVARALHQDDFFKLPPRRNHEARVRDLAHVGPGEVDLARISSLIAAFRAGEPQLTGPLVDYPGDRFVEVTHRFEGAQVLVLDGTYVLGLEEVDLRVFMSATYQDTAQRRRERARDAEDPFVERVLALEHELISAYARRADWVVTRDFRIVG